VRRRLSMRLSVYGIERSLNGSYKTLNGYHMSPTGGHAAFLVSALPLSCPYVSEMQMCYHLCAGNRVSTLNGMFIHTYVLLCTIGSMYYWLCLPYTHTSVY
jgi:hypothetical protein